MNKGLKFHIAFFLFCAAIFIESSFPSDSYPDLDFEFSDKFIHIGIFFVLAFSAYLSFIHQGKFSLINRKSYFFTVIFTAVYGALDEIHQFFVPGRSCDIFDWFADVMGAIIAVFAIILLKKLFKNYNTILKSVYDSN